MKVHVTLEGQRRDGEPTDITLTAEDDRIVFEHGRASFSIPVDSLRDAINHLAGKPYTIQEFPDPGDGKQWVQHTIEAQPKDSATP